MVDGHKKTVTSVAYSPDGTHVVSGSEDRTLRVWDVQTGESRKLVRGHKKTVTTVVFSPDGTRVVSGSKDGAVQIWDVQTRRPIAGPLKGHAGSVLSVAFNLDGTRLVSGSEQVALHIWPTPTETPDLLCAMLTRNLSRMEWHERVSPTIDYIPQCPGLQIPPDEPE